MTCINLPCSRPSISSIPGPSLEPEMSILPKNLTPPPIGTLAHEWIMFHGAIAGYKEANATAMEAWIQVFKGELGIALADTYTTEVFLSSFDSRLAGHFDGVRQDSGDPIAFLKKIVHHYKTLHIDPATKTIIFSDGLDINGATAIHNECRGKHTGNQTELNSCMKILMFKIDRVR